MRFQKTDLWNSALAQRDNDEYGDARDRLRSQLLLMRDKVGQLVAHIPTDCKDLTIHDVTHLDALWEAAQQICGKEWSLNPAEAFVFGAAVLIHDAGLTTLAYPDGKAGLKNTQLWSDLASPYLTYQKQDPKSENTQSLSPEDEQSVLFEILRSLHAEQAAELCTQSWQLSNGQQVFLLEDVELRQAFGEIIGRIAASHHWGIDRLHSELSTQIGGSHELPPDWTVNECKLACLLRCADAAQVDRTRAPLMLYAALGPRGYSDLHWKAQNKLNRPILQKDAIHFSSASVFSDGEADAWWIAFDLAGVLDKELRSSNAVLTDIGSDTFEAQRVAGAESPGTFAKYVRTNGWKPIDASIRVTDPLQIAKTLGGRNLYGNSSTVPFRELIQNSTDAIRARRALQNRGQEFGTIRITIEEDPKSEELCLIHIDDDGIGMSERVMCSTLVDFGKSFWSSNLLREEFPGLRSKSVSHIGKFGIGFFSVFEICQDVKVTSKRYDFGIVDTRTLDFHGIVTRPLLRSSKEGELPVDMSTRVTLRVPKTLTQNFGKNGGVRRRSFRDPYAMKRRSRLDDARTLQDALRGLTAFLNIRVEFADHRNGDTFKHSPNIYEKSTQELMDELFFDTDEKLAVHFDPLISTTPLRSENGDAYGRASLDIDAILDKYKLPRSYISVGGIVSASTADGLSTSREASIPYFGVIEGETERAARDVSTIVAPSEVVDTWLLEQIQNLNKSVLRTSEVMKVASFALSAVGLDKDLPYAYNAGSAKTASEISEIAKKLSRFCVPVSWRYETYVETIGYSHLLPEYFEASLSEDVIVLADGSDRLLDDDDAREYKKNGGGPLSKSEVANNWHLGRTFIELVEKVWEQECEVELARRSIFSTEIASLGGERWVLIIQKKGST